MRSDCDSRLEAEVDRELKCLPELMAPHTLILRVMAAIERRLALPWYRQSWQGWPLALRVVSLAVLLVLFGGFCFATWKLIHTQSFITAMQRPSSWLSAIEALWHAAGLLINAVILGAKKLGTLFWVACLTALALGYAMCVGLGTVYLRLALARR